jgi:hypothetical protein
MNKPLLVGCALMLGCVSLAANAQEAGASHCRLSTLHGTMAWNTTTFSTARTAVSSGSGQESYDGKGNMKYFEFYSDGITSTTYTGTGTYTISDNCIATVTYDSEVVPWVYFVSADGDHYYWNNNQGTGLINSGRADRVSQALLVK